MKARFIFSMILMTVCASLSAQIVITQADKDKASEIVSQMTLEEKVEMLYGHIDGFHTAPLPRFNIPAVAMCDGPQGVRNLQKKQLRSTYFPCGISIASTWNRDAAGWVGDGIGTDAVARGAGIMLCPGMNIYRSALCGRNFEYYGEDPYLAGEMALNMIDGIQGHGIIATAKHFAINNQEFDRHNTGSVADERTMNEIYFPAFRKVIEKGNVGAVMMSYNPVNGAHASENAALVNELRKWGHEGIIMSDWHSTYTTIGCLQTSLDMEMPGHQAWYPEKILPLVKNGVVTEKQLDEKCQHIIQTLSAFGFIGKTMNENTADEDNPYCRELAYKAALEGPVLLKNEGVLPIRPSKNNTILVLGPNADYQAYGGGSGRVLTCHGRSSTIYKGMSELGKGYNVKLRVEAEPEEVSQADVVILCVGFNKDLEYEAADRTYALPKEQVELINRVLDWNDNVVVVINSGGEVDLNGWGDKAEAIVMDWYAGQEGGRALAQLLSGRVSFSGRLPFTYWGSLEKNPAQQYYPVSVVDRAGERHRKSPCVEYREGVFVGYRGVEFFDSKPLYPFGYGLTYSDFQYSDIQVQECDEGYDVTFTIKNIGSCEAAEVAQVYVAPINPCVVRPARELKGFSKINLKKGESQQVTVSLPMEAFSRYDIDAHSWVMDKGEYIIQVGASSQDIRLQSSLEL